MVFLNAKNRFCPVPVLGQGDRRAEPAVTTQGTPAFKAKRQPPTSLDPLPGIPAAPTAAAEGLNLRKPPPHLPNYPCGHYGTCPPHQATCSTPARRLVGRRGLSWGLQGLSSPRRRQTGLRILPHLPTGLSPLLDRRVFLEAHRAPPVRPVGSYRSPQPGCLGASKQQIIKCRPTQGCSSSG